MELGLAALGVIAASYKWSSPRETQNYSKWGGEARPELETQIWEPLATCPRRAR